MSKEAFLAQTKKAAEHWLFTLAGSNKQMIRVFGRVLHILSVPYLTQENFFLVE